MRTKNQESRIKKKANLPGSIAMFKQTKNPFFLDS